MKVRPSGARPEYALTRLRILLAEDHALVRDGLRCLLQTIPDVSMPGLNGLEATRRAADAHAPVRVVMLSVHAGEEYVRQALVAGAAGYLLKNSDRGELVLPGRERQLRNRGNR
jgi:DNA-binding NarL/FixJ family response regulator